MISAKPTSPVLRRMLASLFVGASLIATVAQAQTTLRAAHSSNPGQSVYIYWDELAKRVNTRAEGKLKVQVFPSGQLGADEQIIQGIKGGTIQMGSASNGNMGTTTDAYFWCDLPHVFQDRNTALKAIADPVVKAYLDDSVRKDARAVVLGHIEVGGFRILSNRKREVRVPSDLKGLKFRSLPSPIDRALWEAWGAIPAPLPWSETFVSLEQGVIDGVNLQPQALVGFKFDEVIKHGTMTGTLMAFHVAMINAATWDGLSNELKQIVSTASKEALDVANMADRNDEAKFIKAMEANGIKFYRPTEPELKLWSDAARGIWSKFNDKINKTILDKVVAVQKN